MASSSSSHRWRYDVFPSFRGEDTGRTVLSHLHKEFQRKGIHTFKDHGIKRSRSIGPELIRSIGESRISIVVLSKNYASSGWCLSELVEILKCREKEEHMVMTLFYKVDPSDVRKQTGKFGREFEKICEGKTEGEIRTWKQALMAVANIAGECSQKWDSEADMIEKIAGDVSNELNAATPSRDFDGLVGIQTHLASMTSLLCLDSDEVRMVGIWGPAGIGKTTIARAFFDRFSNKFQSSIIIENNKGIGNRKIKLDDYGFKLGLQERFLSKIIEQKDMKIRHLGAVQERLSNQKVLIVLDDIDEIEQLNAVVDKTRWFGPGSRVIITTEDRQLLKTHGISHIYEVNFPSSEEALEIFSRYAFGKSSPPEDFLALAVETTKLVGNLPLGLSIMGSSLRGKSVDEWVIALPRFRSSLCGKIERVLRVGFDSLHEKDQAIFLHIACLFNGEKIDRVIQLLSGSDLNTAFGINVLMDKCFISISSNKEIVMHSLLQEMGKGVVRQQSIHKPEKRQFLVDDKEICDVLANDIGTSSIKGISLDISKGDELSISERGFKRMHNLQFLRFYNNESVNNKKGRLHFPQGLSSLPPKLRLLHWDAYPMRSIPSRFHHECLVELRMQHSKLENLWHGTQSFKSLKLMDLSFSKELKQIPDLSKATNIENLDLSYCESLIDLHSSIGELGKLKDLLMLGCTKLEALPDNINLESLSSLSMDGCSRLKIFPEFSRTLKSLSLGETAIEQVPSSVTRWDSLVELGMSGSKRLKRFPQVPDNVRILSLSNNDFTDIPDRFKDLTQLRSLDITDCRNLVSLPEFPDSLSYVNADNCESLQRISPLSLCNNPGIVLEFGNCLKLDQETRERIQRSICNYAFLPGRDVPSYFSHRASGTTLTVDLGENSFPAFSGFKACVVIGAGANPDILSLRDDIGISCRINGRQGGGWPMMYPSRLLTDHLCILSGAFRDEDTQATMSKEIRFEFSCSHYKIIGCGVRLLEFGEDNVRSYEDKDQNFEIDFNSDEETTRSLKRMRPCR